MDKQKEYDKKKQEYLKQFIGDETKFLDESKKYDEANKDGSRSWLSYASFMTTNSSSRRVTRES